MEPFVPIETQAETQAKKRPMNGADDANLEASRELEYIHNVLRGEISAVEAYSQVMDKIKDDPESQRLQEFLSDHRKASDYWRSEIDHTNIEVRSGSGPWGVIVEAVVGSAKLFGNKAALMSLREGEEHGLNEYRELLANPDVSPENKQKIREVFIPNQERHIHSINAMIKMQ